jgi:glycine betaine/proline transport system substrate-binding protein
MTDRGQALYRPWTLARCRALGSCLAAVLLVLGGCGKGTEPAETASPPVCGAVSVAEMSWPSAQVLAHVDGIVLRHGFGCQVEIVPGDTWPTLTSMLERGEPDVAPEAWIDAIGQPLKDAVAAGRLHLAARALADGGIEGWWIPRHVAEAHPHIRTIDDALRHPELFGAPGQPGRGVVHGCPAEWSCQVSNAQAFKAWGAAGKGFVLLDPGSAAALDEGIARAHERQAGWLGYHWSPTPVQGRYAMVRLEAGVPHDREAWARCNTAEGCAAPEKNDWARAEVFTVVGDRFLRAGERVGATGYLKQRSWDNETVNTLLAWMHAHNASAEDTARHFLRTQRDAWAVWLDNEETVERVGRAVTH